MPHPDKAAGTRNTDSTGAGKQKLREKMWGSIGPGLGNCGFEGDIGIREGTDIQPNPQLERGVRGGGG